MDKSGNSSGVDAFYYRGRMWPQNEVYITGVNMGTKLGGYIQDILPNPGLTWEKARILNIGIDIQLFSDRLSVTAEFFKDNRHDMYVVNNKISSLVGNVKEFKQNIGKINSHGSRLICHVEFKYCRLELFHRWYILFIYE